ncbi:hypothetical protein ACQEVF_49595 [Nonomuraea polychroma]|uniref:hypothetical protein n=1 Tax=Nonomuraea polychroma TaxID=46176 RepID=UPI003D9118FD
MSASGSSSRIHDELTARLENEGRLFPVMSPGYSQAVGRCTVAGVRVDLESAFRKAQDSKATSLVVFADVVRVPGSFAHTLGDGIDLLSIVARAVEVDGDRAILRLRYDANGARQPVVRIVTDVVTGTFLIWEAQRPQVRRQLAGCPREEPLRYRSYTCDGDGLAERQGRLSLDLLDVSSPLRQVLTASFDMAAGLMLAHVPPAAEQDLARSLLRWIVRWSAYPSPYLARLFQDAETLGQMLPVTAEGRTIHNLPLIPSDMCLRLARSQRETAMKYELDRSFDGVREDLHKVVSEVVGAWISRDEADLSGIDREIQEARARISESTAALERVAKDIGNQAFDTTLKGITLEGALARDRFIKVVKAAFDITFSVVQIGVAVSGVVGNPAAAGALAGINPVTFFKTAAQLGGQAASFADKLWPAVQFLYTTPYVLYNAYKAANDSDKEKLSESLKSVAPAATRLLEAASMLIKINDSLGVAEKIGHLVSQTAGVPNVIESKAVWDSFDAETSAEFEKITRDDDAGKAIVDAVYAYRTAVKKFAIYQRAYAEQQALLAQQVRELGTLLIRRDGIQQKKAALTSLRNDLSRNDKTVEQLRSLRDARLYEMRQSFFTTLCRYRAAYFYENLAWPPHMPPLVVPGDAGQMSEALADVDRALVSVRAVEIGDFERKLVFKRTDQEEFFADLQAKGEARFTIETGSPVFARDHLVRLGRVRAWLVGTGTSPVSIELLTGTEFHDRPQGNEPYTFSGVPYSIAFEYAGDAINFEQRLDGVRPTPFTTWSLRVDASDLALSAVQQIEIVMLGTSSVRRVR